MSNIINKVVYDGNVLIDLTTDTVTASDVMSGVTVHLADGTKVSGTMTATSTPTADTIAKWDNSVHMNSADMSAQDVSDFVDALNVSPLNFIDIFYPVGSYYETSDDTFDPNISWGGTWSLETEGQVHISSGENYEIGDIGGDETHIHTTANHTLTTSQIPSHSHNIASNGSGMWIPNASSSSRSRVASSSSSSIYCASMSSTGGYTWQTTTANAGSGGAHNHGDTGSGSNMQPYIVVNRWHRTA